MTFFLKKIASYPDLEEKDFRLSVKMLFGGLVKTAFNLSRKNFFFRKEVLLKSFSLCNETFLGFLFKNFQQVCQNCVFGVQRNILRFFCRKKPYQFWLLSALRRNFTGKLDKIEFGVCTETFWRILILRKKLLFSWFPDIGRNQRDVLKNYFQQDCQICIFGFRRNTLFEHIPWRS